MSKPFSHGILCEDKAHRNFIRHYLTQCHPEQFQENEPFGWRIYATNAKEVDDSVADATRLGFTQFGLDVLIVGRDADKTDPKLIDELKSKLLISCGKHPKVVLMVPVQCIEHWLLYVKRHRDNPTSTKNESLETISRIESKKLIYGSITKPDRQVEIASELLTDFDVNWLESRSDSFKHFHNQVKTFINQHP